MLFLLAFRHLLVRKGRSLVLLLGFALGVGVMIVLLSVGEAMLAQSRDVALVGGGQVTVLPEGIDIEAMRTGGVTGMFFGIDRARYLTRQLLGGPRQHSLVAAVAPAIENKLIYLRAGGRTVVTRAGGEIPSRARRVGGALQLLAGRWDDTPADSAYIAPTPQQLFDELDHFHLPTVPDSTWAEWHYFNVVTAPDEWWYVTLLIGGAVPAGRWGGQLLVTHRRPDGRYERFADQIPPNQIRFDTAAADLTLGASLVRQRLGTYQVSARVGGRLALDFTLRPAPNRYFPAAELRAEPFISGYVVPALSGSVDGRFCADGRCRTVAGGRGYHDHNWGVWRAVTWEWGVAHGAVYDVLYGGVRTGDSAAGGAPFFFMAADSLGIRQVLRFRDVRYTGVLPTRTPGVSAPSAFALTALREADTVDLAVNVGDALASETAAADFRRFFLQMRGRFTLRGKLGGVPVADSGMGFFETYVGGRAEGGKPRR
jgi:hypothetical protein